MSKICYSALFSNYENIKEPTIVTPNWQYILFTDQNVTSNVWEIRKIDLNGANPQLMARYYKIMGWFEWDKSYWIDSSFIITTNLDDWWQKYFKGGFSAPRHPLRQDVYAECLDCIISKRGDRSQIEAQMAEYKSLNIPQNNGLIASGILMRENRAEVIDLCNRWWTEVELHSIRDQIAFCRVSMGCGFVHMYDFDYRREKDFIYKHHFHRR